MAAGDPSLGHQARFAFDAAAPFDASSVPLELISETLSKKSTIIDTNGLRGTRSHHSIRTRAGNDDVSGTIVWNPAPSDLDDWLPRILGGAESTDTFPLAETLPEFVCLFDRVANVYLYSGCKVSKATFSGSPGGLVQLSLDVIAKSETNGQTYAGSIPALTVAANDVPYMFSDSVITLVGGTREVIGWEIVIDNAAEARFTNSVNATDILLMDRIVTLGVNLGFYDGTTGGGTDGHEDLLEQALLGTTATIVITNAAMATTFTFGVLQSPSKTPTVTGKGEIPIDLEMTARMTGTTAEVVVTHDSVA